MDHGRGVFVEVDQPLQDLLRPVLDDLEPGGLDLVQIAAWPGTHFLRELPLTISVTNTISLSSTLDQQSMQLRRWSCLRALKTEISFWILARSPD